LATLHVADFRLSIALAFGTFFDAILIRVQSEEMKFESIDSEFGLGRILVMLLLPVIKMSRR